MWEVIELIISLLLSRHRKPRDFSVTERTEPSSAIEQIEPPDERKQVHKLSEILGQIEWLRRAPFFAGGMGGIVTGVLIGTTLQIIFFEFYVKNVLPEIKTLNPLEVVLCLSVIMAIFYVLGVILSKVLYFDPKKREFISELRGLFADSRYYQSLYTVFQINSALVKKTWKFFPEEVKLSLRGTGIII